MSRSLSSFIKVKKKKSPTNRTDSHKKYKELCLLCIRANVCSFNDSTKDK